MTNLKFSLSLWFKKGNFGNVLLFKTWSIEDNETQTGYFYRSNRVYEWEFQKHIFGGSETFKTDVYIDIPNFSSLWQPPFLPYLTLPQKWQIVLHRYHNTQQHKLFTGHPVTNLFFLSTGEKIEFCFSSKFDGKNKFIAAVYLLPFDLIKIEFLYLRENRMQVLSRNEIGLRPMCFEGKFSSKNFPTLKNNQHFVHVLFEAL